MAATAIIRVVRSLTGADDLHADLAKQVHTAIGVAALSDIKTDYVRKARGETGEDGVKWAPLKPATIARRRGVNALDQEQMAEYRSNLARLAASMGIQQAREMAAKIMGVEILRDTGVLLNSLSPGVMVGENRYEPPEQQIFNLTASGVIVGTNVPYASTHQNGSRKRNIPARPFLPVGEIPSVWARRWANVAQLASSKAIQMGISTI